MKVDCGELYVVFKMDQKITSRPYQIELYEKAVAANSIIYLPTGAGKTYIAVLVIAELSRPLHKPYAVDGKKTIFLVNTVALVQQQCTFLARHTGLIVKGYTGDQQVDRWPQERWLQEITSSQVMVMTSQIFLDLLEHGIMPLSKVNLLIFDECHHAVKDHPMKQIMRRFENWPVNQHPRVLGLSACLLNANVASIDFETTVKDLEATFQSKVITVETLETVSVFSTKPKEVIEHYDPLKESDIISEICNLLINASEKLRILGTPDKHANNKMRSESKTIKLARMLDDIIEQIKETGLYGGLKSILLHMIKIDCIRKSSFEEVSPYINFVNTQLMKIQKLINDSMTGAMSQHFLDSYISPKVLKLVEVLKKFYCTQKSKDKFCCIIFVQRRFTAKVIYLILKELSLQDESLNFLKPDYIVGQNNDSKINAREQLCLSKWNKEVLQKFKNGIINCLVATDVVDEGIDIPKCTLVVRFYAPMDFRSYIQSKGRARHSTSSFVVLVQQGNRAYLRRYDEYQKTERTLQEALHSHITREAPTAEEIDETLYNYDIEPHVITLENDKKSIITEQNAISLINTYCLSLGSSRYSTMTPIWKKEEDILGQFRIDLTLPVKSPLNGTIKSDDCTSFDAAKRSAAFKACVKLYEIGELNDHLLPKSKVTVVEHAESLFPHMQSQNTATTNTKRKYPLTYPKALFGAYPQEEMTLYLHVIEMIPDDYLNVESVSEMPNSSFYNIFTSKNTYGILSTKKLPEIPIFPIFTNAGVFQINIKINSLVSPLTEFEINQLKQFHYLIFNEILKVSKDFMIFDTDNQENCFLVVPVIDDQKIDWDVVRSNERISTIQPSKPLKVKASDYHHQLILPTYRASNIYFVTEVCSQIKPTSPFATEAYDSYADYFEKKHNVVIENLDQPMLDVRPLSREMNWLKPRIVKTSSNYNELLVPELCEKITFPTVYWLKASTLPSILHRISQLLVAEDLRFVIASQAGLNINKTSADKWDPLIITQNCEKSFSSNNHIASNDNTLSGDDLNSSTSSNVAAAVETNVFSLNKSLYKWTKEQEPLDLERNADILTPQDLDYYNSFMNHMTREDKINWEHHNSTKCNYSVFERKQEPPLQMIIKTSAHGPSPVDILQSLTAKTSNDVINYERLETLGDAFLKYTVSLFLYQNYPSYGERLLTELKGKMVSNSNFFGCGQLKNLAGKMNVKEFTPTESCIVPSFGVDAILKKLMIKAEISASVLHDIKIPQEERFSGIMTKDTVKKSKECFLIKINDLKNTGAESFLGHQVVSEKCISDCVEAVIGIHLARLGVEEALKVVKWFQILPKTASIESLMYSGIQDPRRGNGSVDQYMPWASAIEKRIGYTFRNRAFLLEAFTHISFTSNRITDSYERLEFLGDAVLDFLLTVYIYEASGNLNPGELTDLRSALVNNITFACLSVRYGLHTALLSHSPELFGAIDEFVRFQEDRNYKVDDELLWVLLEEDDCNMSEHVDVPKVLGDIFESVIGAVYLDSAKNLRVTWHVVYNLMKQEIGAFSSNVPKQPIRVIYETIGANPSFSATQAVEGSSNLMVTLSINDGGNRKHFHGFASTKKLAKCAASKQALKYLRAKK